MEDAIAGGVPHAGVGGVVDFGLFFAWDVWDCGSDGEEEAGGEAGAFVFLDEDSGCFVGDVAEDGEAWAGDEAGFGVDAVVHEGGVVVPCLGVDALVGTGSFAVEVEVVCPCVEFVEADDHPVGVAFEACGDLFSGDVVDADFAFGWFWWGRDGGEVVFVVGLFVFLHLDAP